MHIYGTETEFGITTRDGQVADPVVESLFLVNHYPLLPSAPVVWNYEEESPLLDSRGFEVEGVPESPGSDYNRLLNKPLHNGGRLYVDGAHPEYSTPECSSPREVVIHEKAGEQIMLDCLRAVLRARPDRGVIVYKNNTDGKGNSYGYHENYLFPREFPFDQLTAALIPFFVTRQIFAGAGKVGAENGTDPAVFQISQRADFFETIVGLNTMNKRSIMNTRDEPHADSKKYRRIHVIVGDANMSETSIYVKIGIAGVVLDMIAAGISFASLELADPLGAMKSISRDLSVTAPVRLASGKVSSAIEIQRTYLKKAQDFIASDGTDEQRTDVLRRWDNILNELERDPMTLVTELDWVAKYAMMTSYMGRKGCGWDDPRIRMMDFQYHDIRPEKGLYFALLRQNRISRLVSDEEIVRAEMDAPAGTRAYFRSACLKKYPKEVYATSWSSILFATESDILTKLSLLEPTQGTEQLTKKMLDASDSVPMLLAKLADSSRNVRDVSHAT
ncbi:MAG: proteasome accessory factor PafA2 [Nitrospiraceae bacterium]|jgi:proteasome accessory factor A|nr:proteasome accessory factor PafA2 [Nitrospiraceae bacterium]